MANVPAHQDFKHKVHAKAYRCAERNGLIWIFMGDQAKVPALPQIEATLVAERDNNIDVFMRECNWLQSLEGDLDTSHVGFLHGGHRTAAEYGKEDLLRYGTLRRDPEYDVMETDWGAMYGAYRPGSEGNTYWRIGHFMFPFWSITPSAPFGLQVYARAWVPIDDEHTMSFRIVWKEGRIKGTRGGSATIGMADTHLPNTSDWLGRYRLKANRANDYLIDRGVQQAETYTGIVGISEQDQMATESMGPITDWDFEHLAPSDRMITTARRRLLGALKDFQRGERPPMADTPDVYYQARGGYFEAPVGAKMADIYKDKVEETRATIPYAVAAE
jgi:hypothetical protein